MFQGKEILNKLYFIVLFSLLGLIVIYLALYIFVKTNFAIQTSGNLAFEGLDGMVTIFRDRNGIPHINAHKSDADAFFALGFVHAQDRLWQMEFQRRLASGTLSEVFGEDTLAIDRYFRTFQFAQLSAASLKHYELATKKIIESYTAGINAYIKQGKLPIEFTLLRYKPSPWKVTDSIILQRILAWDLQRHSWMLKIDYALAQKYYPHKSIYEFFPDYPQKAPIISANNGVDATIAKQLIQLRKQETQISAQLNRVENVGKGSNAWVIANTHSTTGKPILANDVHLSPSAPSLWYLVELRGPTIHVKGGSIPSVPGIAIGHNDKIAWGMTNGCNDAAELYIIQPKDKLSTIEETIYIRNQSPEKFRFLMSAYGPVLNATHPKIKNLTKQYLALKWTALLDHDTTVQSALKINYANNWDEFKTALKDFVTPTQNFVYADTAGNFGFYYPGLLPIKKWRSLTPVPTDTKYEWHDWIPFDALPHEYNPQKPYIATANNKVVNDRYPYLLNARWPIPPYRIQRIMNLLNSKSHYSVVDMQKMQADTFDEMWFQLKNYLLNFTPQDSVTKYGYKQLSTWSGDMNRHLIAPTIYAQWLASFNDLTPPPFQHNEKNIDALYLQQRLQNGLSDDYLLQHLFSSLETINRKYGPDTKNWRWGDVHHAELKGFGLGESKWLGWIWNRKVATSGGDHTINMGNYNPQNFKQAFMATYREIIDLNNLDNSLFMIPMGQSGNPFSSHYDDLLHKWRHVHYLKISSVAACQNPRKCLTLTPS